MEVLKHPAREAADAKEERQIVALHLGNEIYGVDIAAIHTVLTPQAITPVPRTLDYVAGVMNLRGRIVPVIDLRRRFGLPEASEEKRRSARIVIVEVDGLSAGLIVDAVSEVLRLSSDAIDPPSRLVSSADMDCIQGIGRIPVEGQKEGASGDERLIILLDVYQTLANTPQDAGALKTLQAAA